MKKVYCTASGRIAFGARVLVRGMRAEAADPSIANGTAVKPWWRGRFYKDGEHIVILMDEGIGDRDLHAIANGPIMDPSLIYLPAGRISMAEYRERQREILNPDGEPR